MTNNIKNGIGVLISDCGTFVGHFKDDLKCGFGYQLLNDGTVMVGKFVGESIWTNQQEPTTKTNNQNQQPKPIAIDLHL